MTAEALRRSPVYLYPAGPAYRRDKEEETEEDEDERPKNDDDDCSPRAMRSSGAFTSCKVVKIRGMQGRGVWIFISFPERLPASLPPGWSRRTGCVPALSGGCKQVGGRDDNVALPTTSTEKEGGRLFCRAYYQQG